MKVSKEDLNKMNRADEFYRMNHGENKRRCSTHKSSKEYSRKEKYKRNYE